MLFQYYMLTGGCVNLFQHYMLTGGCVNLFQHYMLTGGCINLFQYYMLTGGCVNLFQYYVLTGGCINLFQYYMLTGGCVVSVLRVDGWLCSFVSVLRVQFPAGVPSVQRVPADLLPGQAGRHVSLFPHLQPRRPSRQEPGLSGL